MKECVMSGPVTKHLAQLIAKQIEDKGLVVWYDPERAYASVPEALGLSNTTFVRFEGSFIALRKAVDDRLNDTQQPRLVVYVPMDRTETHSALIELDCAGVVMQPRQQPPACNTRLSVVARHALKPILGEEQVGENERQVESGKLSLADLNTLAEQGVDISIGVLKLIFGSVNPQDVALAFLHSDRHDDAVEKKSAQKELRHLLHLGFDIALPAAEPLSNLRVRLARHLLLTDLFAALETQIPDALYSVSVAESPGGIDACVRLAHTWRTRRTSCSPRTGSRARSSPRRAGLRIWSKPIPRAMTPGACSTRIIATWKAASTTSSSPSRAITKVWKEGHPKRPVDPDHLAGDR